MKKVAGSLRLDLSQFRELEAFAKFGSELDEETQSARWPAASGWWQLLNQPQYAPWPVEDQVMVIFAATRAILDDVAVARVARFNDGPARLPAQRSIPSSATIATTQGPRRETRGQAARGDRGLQDSIRRPTRPMAAGGRGARPDMALSETYAGGSPRSRTRGRSPRPWRWWRRRACGAPSSASRRRGPTPLNMLEFIGRPGARTPRRRAAVPAAEGARGGQDGGRHRPHRRPGAVRAPSTPTSCAGRSTLERRATRPRASRATWSSWAARASAPLRFQGCRLERSWQGLTDRPAFSRRAGHHRRGHPALRQRRGRPGAPGLQPLQERHGADVTDAGDPAHPGGSGHRRSTPRTRRLTWTSSSSRRRGASSPSCCPPTSRSPIYRAILEGSASEHGARMTAMRNASESAEEMIDS